MGRLAGKCALITGGTTGIGLETARQFLREGARVMITGNNPKNLESAQKELGSDIAAVISDAADVVWRRSRSPPKCASSPALSMCCLSTPASSTRAADRAGSTKPSTASFAINLKGPFFLVQSLLPVFANPASIVLNASVNAHIGMPNTTVYAATKAALLSLVRTLSGELIGRGIRVNAVSPGPISTPLYGKLGFSEAELKNVAASIQSQVPAKRFGTPSEIASAVVFFASDESAFTVGSELLIDGGMSNL